MIKSYLAVLRNKKFFYLWWGQITSQIALNMLSFVLAIRVYQETKSNTLVSLMLLTFAVPAIIFGFIAGGVVDFYDKRKVMLFCNLSRVIIYILFFLFSKTLFMLYLLSIIISILTQLFIPAEGPAIPYLVNNQYLLSANSLFTISFYLSTLLGFILAGPFLNLVGSPAVYLIMGFIMLVAAIFIYLLPAIKSTVSVRSSNFSLNKISSSIKEGISFIKSYKRVFQSLVLITFSQVLIATLAVLAPGFSDRVLSIELTSASFLVMGPAALGLILGAVFVGGYGVKFLKGSLIVAGILTTGATLIILSLLTKATVSSIEVRLASTTISINNLTIAMILLLILGISNSFINIPSSTILQQETKSEMRGRVYGVLTAATGGVSLLPVIFSGVLADVVGVGRALSIIGLIILTIGVYNIIQRRMRVYL